MIIRNLSGRQLPIARLKLNLDALGIFEAGAALWGNETRIAFRGTEFEQIDVIAAAPAEAGAARLLTAARSGGARTFSGKTFEKLLSLPGLNWGGK